MQNISVCKAAAVILGILLGAGAALLAVFGLLPGAAAFFVPFIAAFAGVVILLFAVLFVKTSCSDYCSVASSALCRDSRFILVSAIAALLFALFASAAVGILNILFAILFGLAVLFFVVLVVGVYSFTRNFCTCRCSRDCDCSSVPVSR